MKGVKYCPECGGLSTIIDSRIQKDGTIRRRRMCLKNKYHRWSTVEMIVLEDEGNNDSEGIPAADI